MKIKKENKMKIENENKKWKKIKEMKYLLKAEKFNWYEKPLK